jgi:predicted RND superfamily exporter protein
MRWILRFRLPLLFVVLALTVFFAVSLRDFRIAFSFDSFRPKDTPELEFFETYSDSFPTYENTVLVAFAGPKGDVWDLDFLREVDATFERMRRVPSIDTVISPTRLLHYQRSGMGIQSELLIDLDSLARMPLAERQAALRKSQALMKADELLGTVFFSEDGQYISGTLQVDPDVLDLPARDSMSHALREVVAASGLPHVISGVPYIRTQYVEMISSELGFFLGISIFLAIIVMYWLFRSWWGVLLPLLGVGIAMLWTLGLMAAVGHPLDIIGELLPTVLFVSGISDIIHLVTRYQTDLETGLPGRDVMRLTLDEIGGALLLTCLTTAIGFVTLYSSPLPPIRAFGIFAAAGVIFAWIAVIVVVPNVLLQINVQKVRHSKGSSNNVLWARGMNAIYVWVKGKGKLIIGATVLVLAVSGVGMSLISYDSYLLDDVSPKDPTRANMQFFEDHFYGARSFEMAIMAKPGHLVTDLEVLQDLDTIQDFLRAQERMSPFFSTVNYLKGANQLYRGGNARHFKLPGSEDRVEELIGFGSAAGAADALKLTMTPGRTMARISAKMGDIGSYRFEELRQRLDEFIRKNCRPGNFDYHLTGLAVINEANADVLREGLFNDLIMAVAMIAILMGIMFLDLRMALVAMLPNIIPLVVTAGMMGFAGITLRPSTSIVFLIAFGIATDDTIHFMSRFRHELRMGRDVETGIYNATMGTGKAMIIAAMILLAGFGSLMSSSFGGTFIIGLFTAVTLVVAVVSDLLLLPALIRISGIKGKATVEPELAEVEA